MLYYRNLNNLFFESYPSNATAFIALSGFVGPEPIGKLLQMPFESTVIFGLQKENVNTVLHDQLLRFHSDNCRIYYPEIACHSKCYLWLNGGQPIKGLVGSANFSANGLKNDYRESLAEIDKHELYVLKGYIEIILSSARQCTDIEIRDITGDDPLYNQDVCEMILYDPNTGQTQNAHGLNWGFANANVRRNDACIPIRTDHIRKYPKLFPPLQPNPEVEGDTLKEIIELVWDDGVIMEGRLEGSQPLPNHDYRYPKQIASYPHKDQLGVYFRTRMGIPLGQRITMEDLVRYGRNSVSVSLIEEGVYYVDFSVK